LGATTDALKLSHLAVNLTTALFDNQTLVRFWPRSNIVWLNSMSF
jgi:hypothetical protein